MPTPLTWDSPAGLTYDMPGLTWDMQQPDPPPPKPKKKASGGGQLDLF